MEDTTQAEDTWAQVHAKIREENRLEREYYKTAEEGTLFYMKGAHFSKVSLVKVAKVTKTQIVLDNRVRLNRETMRQVGANAYGPNYYPALPHITERFELAAKKEEVKDALRAAARTLDEALADKVTETFDSDNLEAMLALTERFKTLASSL
jgi:type 1 glutamine amidotransferase